MCYGAIWYDFDIILTDYVPGDGRHDARFSPTLLVAPPITRFQMRLYALRRQFAAGSREAAWTFLGNLLGLDSGASPGTPRPGRKFVLGNFTSNSAAGCGLLVTGMAPIKRDVAAFFSRMQLPLCESYGLVETGSLTYRPPDSNKYGSVGENRSPGVKTQNSPNDGEDHRAAARNP